MTVLRVARLSTALFTCGARFPFLNQVAGAELQAGASGLSTREGLIKSTFLA
jgi:hypothetical protein